MSPFPSDDAVIADLPGWSLVAITGRDRERFLASQVTSDVAGLTLGDSQLSALLDRSGRLQSFFFVCKRAESLELLVPDEVVEPCLERLAGHVIADDVEISRRETGPMRIALGPSAAATVGEEDFPVAGWGTRGFVTWSGRPLPWPTVSTEEFEPFRVLGGPPAWGREVRAATLVNETVLVDTAVSFDKGCYLGQETVAKVASRRGAAWGTMVLELDAPGTDTLVGEVFGVGERARAGEVLATADWRDRTWLVVRLHRELRVEGRAIECVFSGGRLVGATVHAAPLLPAPSPVEMADRLTAAASGAFAEGRNEDSLGLLDRAIAVCPTSADAHEAKGVILGRIGRIEEAIAVMERLLEIDPASVMAHSNLSLLHNQLGDRERAEHHLAMSTRLSMGGATAAPATGENDAAEADRRRREEMYRQVLEIDPGDALALFGLGELAAERGRYDDAVKHLERAVAADPTHAAAILALGTAYERLERAGEAREVYERGVDIAAKKGDAASARKIQERLNALAEPTR